jgi:hypothetical protein
MTDDSTVIVWLREYVKGFADMQDVSEVLAARYREQAERFKDCPRPGLAQQGAA